MTYELAKQLQDAGFPLNTDGDGYSVCECSHLSDDNEAKEVLGHTHRNAYVPTLSELIEAVERLTFHYWGLEKHSKDYRAGLLKPGGIDEKIMVSSSTPEAAMAKLWLELNKNK